MNNEIKNSKNIEEIKSLLSHKRLNMFEALSNKNWFKQTDFEVIKKIFLLPDDFDGYLNDLTTRKDEYGGLIVNKLHDLLPGNYSALSVFEVVSIQTAQPFTHEYMTWKFGRDQGYRGLILFEEEGEIKFFMLRKAEKFAIGESVYETIGTFIKEKHISESSIPDEVQHQIDKELGMKDVKVKKFIPLGKIAVDPVMANSTPSLYAVTIDLPGDNDLEEIRSKVYKSKPISFNLIIEPIEKIWEYVNKTDESFFLAVVARLTSMGIIKPQA